MYNEVWYIMTMYASVAGSNATCQSQFLLTLGTHAQEGYGSWVCVCVCVSVCLSVKSHLTSGVSVHPEYTVTYSVGNGGPKKLWGFL